MRRLQLLVGVVGGASASCAADSASQGARHQRPAKPAAATSSGCAAESPACRRCTARHLPAASAIPAARHCGRLRRCHPDAHQSFRLYVRIFRLRILNNPGTETTNFHSHGPTFRQSNYVSLPGKHFRQNGKP